MISTTKNTHSDEDFSVKRAHIDNLIATGKFRNDRHGHLLPYATVEHTAQQYDQFADTLWAKNQELYESFWGPVPWLHPDDFDERLSAWLDTADAGECIRGRTLRDLEDIACDEDTRKWIYNPSDVAAIKAGFRWDRERAHRALAFYSGSLILYEGEYAGKLFRPLAWQVELFCRQHGWVGCSNDWGREVRRFRKVMAFIPKKSGKSPTGAAVGMELTIAEGEQGAKTFSAAKDGKQATIIHSHARQFVKKHDIAQGKSNRLGCKVNKSTGEIYHEASESYYRVLSGDNIDGQEGLNGSVIIDETHVVDQRLASVLEYMGASRPEPLQFEISTSGRDPNGYGKSQFDYGSLVESGEVIDHEVLFMGFGVFVDPKASDGKPQDEFLGSERTWQRCNPSWFVTIKPSEFEKAFTRAKQRGKAKFDTFCMYRLNKWLSGGSPWLDVADWLSCAQSWALEDKAGYECSLGVDLSRCKDMSAVTVSVRDEETVWQKTYLWITQRYVEQWKERIPQWQTWIDDDLVTEVPGELIDYRAIYEQILQVNEVLPIASIVYDPTYSSALLQWLNEKIPNATQIQFDQNSTVYEGRIDDFEAAVKERAIIHDGNKCMTWQAGHCETKQNARGNRILIKPVSKDDPRKIDGMVASVMSRSGAMLTDSRPNFYTRNAVEMG